jgi:SSS family transporter
MHWIDWLVLCATLGFVFFYGIYKSRNVQNSTDFLAGKRDLPWWTIGLSIMATQASAITFLSTPGQGFNDGLQFVQFYFGMPIAMVFLALFILPVYYRLRVTTAYEFLEQRFDRRMRTLTAILFLVQRGIAAAISIYAPSIILCVVFGWNLAFTNFLMAIFVVFYTTTGGSAAVSRTQELQMSIMLGGLVLAFFLALHSLPEGIGLSDAWHIASLTGKTQAIDWTFKWDDRYNVWSGILGATFLFLSYFGTDQSQVGRYLSGKSLKESRFGLLFNGFVKIPMQFLVLSVGVMVFVFYQFNQAPLHFNPSNIEKLAGKEQEQQYRALENQATVVFENRQSQLTMLAEGIHRDDAQQIEYASNALRALDQQQTVLRKEAQSLIRSTVSGTEAGDKDFVFIHFILSKIPVGLIGLMIAVVFCGSWSTTASELSALTATTVSDIYRRSLAPGRDDKHYFKVSRITTVLWGGVITIFATYADLFENLIQIVNMVGSIFYGTILGIFFTAFFLSGVGGKAVFWAALLTQCVIAYLFFFVDKNPYLWYNPLGCFMVMGFSILFQRIFHTTKQD